MVAAASSPPNSGAVEKALRGGSRHGVLPRGAAPRSELRVRAAALAGREDLPMAQRRMLECMKERRHCVASMVAWWLPRLARRWISQVGEAVCVSRRQESIVLDALPELRGMTGCPKQMLCEKQYTC